jgi:hypothetical protein
VPVRLSIDEFDLLLHSEVGSSQRCPAECLANRRHPLILGVSGWIEADGDMPSLGRFPDPVKRLRLIPDRAPASAGIRRDATDLGIMRVPRRTAVGDLPS